MKKLLPFFIASIFSLSINAQAPTLSFTNVTGSNSITCSYPNINVLVGVNNTTIAPLTYTWAGPAALSGTNVTINTPGNYTVIAFNIANSFSVTQVYSVGVNTIVPTSTVNPVILTITCGSPIATFTGNTTSTLTNVTNAWYSPFSSGSAVNNGTISIIQLSAPGSYTYCVTNNINGCSTCKTTSVISPSGFPTFSVSSPQQFLIGCVTSTSAINISNASTSPIPGGPLSYTVLPPTFVGPSYTLGGSASYSVNIPGTYTVIVHDNTNACESKVQVTVIQNTVTPNISISALTQTLDCNTPTVLVQGSSTNTNTNISYAWAFPGPGSAITSSVLVNSISPATNTVIGNYSLTLTNNVNACSSTSVITFYQNKAIPTPSIMGQNSISCAPIMLTNASLSNVPPIFFPTLPTIGYIWYGPVPQASLMNSSNYQAYTGGTYTLIVKDLNNGCTAIATKTVADTGIHPVISSPNPFNIYCPNPTASIYPIITGTSTGYTYSWTVPATATVSSIITPTIITNSPGNFTVTVTDPNNSCSSSIVVSVAICAGIDQNSLSNNTISIFPNPTNGIFNVDFTSLAQNSVVEIYSTLGVLVKKQSIISEKSTVNLQNEPSGLYIVYVISGDKAIKVSKIVKK